LYSSIQALANVITNLVGGEGDGTAEYWTSLYAMEVQLNLQVKATGQEPFKEALLLIIVSHY